MKGLLLASIFGGVLASGGAMSAESTGVQASSKAAPAKLYSWEGFYLGANAGYAWDSNSHLDPGGSGVQTGVFPDGPAQLAAQLAGLAPLGLSTKGSLVGGQIGYNWQAGALVWGIETVSMGLTSPARQRGIQITLSSAFRRLACRPSCLARHPSTRSEPSEVESAGHPSIVISSMRPAGSLTVMPSSSVGVSQIEVLGDTFTSSTGRAVKTLSGWTIGGGWEWALAANWSIKTEYLYYDLETLHYAANPIFGIAFMGPPFTLTTFNPSTEFKGSIFRAGLNWRLGGAG